VNLSVNKLPNQGLMFGKIGWKGVLDPVAKSLWAPISPVVGPVVPGCQGIFCDQYANYDYPSWLYEVKYEQVLNAGLRVLDAWIDQPFIDSQSSAFIEFNIHTNHHSTARSSESGFWLFPKDDDEPVLVRQISRGDCDGGNCDYGNCDYGAKFRQSLLDDQPPGRVPLVAGADLEHHARDRARTRGHRHPMIRSSASGPSRAISRTPRCVARTLRQAPAFRPARARPGGAPVHDLKARWNALGSE
jgi:hypothetical protein